VIESPAHDPNSDSSPAVRYVAANRDASVPTGVEGRRALRPEEQLTI
jgi:hypothetical protein